VSKIKKYSIKPIDQLKIVAMCLILLLIIITAIMVISKKEEHHDNYDKILKTEIDQNGEFAFDTNEKNKTIVFKISNESKEEKKYNLGLTHITNSLENFSFLTYDLWINDEEEIYNEIFPQEDMLLLDGATIDANKNLEVKLILKYETPASEQIEKQTIRGKITIEED
jgi:hypothetical protein